MGARWGDFSPPPLWTLLFFLFFKLSQTFFFNSLRIFSVKIFSRFFLFHASICFNLDDLLKSKHFLLCFSCSIKILESQQFSVFFEGSEFFEQLTVKIDFFGTLTQEHFDSQKSSESSNFLNSMKIFFESKQIFESFESGELFEQLSVKDKFFGTLFEFYEFFENER